MKVGAIPYQNTLRGIEICLVSSRRHANTLTLPKGIVKPQEKLTAAALRELFEEAGIIGQVKKKSAPLLFTTTRSDMDDVLYFFVEIHKIKKKWPEAKCRSRHFLPLEDVCSIPIKGAVKKILAKVAKQQRQGENIFDDPGKRSLFKPRLANFSNLKEA